MKLIFIMCQMFEMLFPVCSNDLPEFENCDPLSAILSDYGGFDLQSMTDWVVVGISSNKGFFESHDSVARVYNVTSIY